MKVNKKVVGHVAKVALVSPFATFVGFCIDAPFEIYHGARFYSENPEATYEEYRTAHNEAEEKLIGCFDELLRVMIPGWKEN